MTLASKDGAMNQGSDEEAPTTSRSSHSTSYLLRQTSAYEDHYDGDSDSDTDNVTRPKQKEMGKLLHKRRSKTPSDSPLDTHLTDDDYEEEVDNEVDSEQIEVSVHPLPKIIEQAEEIAHKVWEAGWEVVSHHHLPQWLRDNDFLLHGHRPELRSFIECFKSIFRIHTETGNIWSHLLGFTAFVGMTMYFISRPSLEIQWQEKLVFSAFFFGAILCLGFSWVFHTVYCHSEKVGKLFNKLDYCGICLLVIGSFVPWLYYNFYCSLLPKVLYIVSIFVLGMACLIVSLLDFFATPRFRAFRAGMFIALGLSGIVPAMHFVIVHGFWNAINKAALGWLCLMALLYIVGAVIYAVRIPERIFPGKCDIWFQSHQLFHLFVIAAAFVHYHGITEIAHYRLSLGDCMETIAV